MSALTELEDAEPGTLLAAGADVFTKRVDGRWFRADDGAVLTSADVADFHGHSGYSLVTPPTRSTGEEQG